MFGLFCVAGSDMMKGIIPKNGKRELIKRLDTIRRRCPRSRTTGI